MWVRAGRVYVDPDMGEVVHLGENQACEGPEVREMAGENQVCEGPDVRDGMCGS